jgi:hypothetical protein
MNRVLVAGATGYLGRLVASEAGLAGSNPVRPRL